jgi:Dolichyl-phosphate-mannose-protein mannosyltransferase
MKNYKSFSTITDWKRQGKSMLAGNQSLKLWGSRLASLTVLLLVGYSGYRIMICHPLTGDVAKAWDFSQFYLTKGTFIAAAAFALILAAGCALCAKILHKDLLILSLPAVMIVCTGNAGALAGFFIQAMAGLAVGLPVYRRIRGCALPGESSLTGLILSWFLGGSINAYIAWIALHWRINFACIYFGVAFAEIFLLRRTLSETLVVVARRIQSCRFTPGQWAIIAWAIFVLPYSLIPLYGFDDCIRHIFFPKQVALFARHVFDPSNIWSLDTEVFAQSYYTISYLLGGEYALRFSNLAASVAAMMLLEDCCRRLFGLGAAFCTALALVSTPLLGVTVLVVYLETFNFFSVAALVVVALYGLQSLDRNTVFLSFPIAAFAFLYKQQAVFLALPLALVLFLASAVCCIKNRFFKPLVWFAGGVASAIIIVTPFLAQNYILTNNPFFPWFNSVFHSEFFPSVNNLGYRFDQPLYLGTLADLTFRGELFVENGSFLFGINCFVLALFLPFGLAGRKNMLLKWTLFGLFAASLLLWWKITSPNLRYFVGPLVPGAFLIGLIMNSLWDLIRFDRLARVLGCLALGAAMFINVMSLLNSNERICFYPLTQAFTRQYNSLGPYMSSLEEIKKVHSVSYARLGKWATCLLVSSPFLCMADQHIEGINHTYPRNWLAMNNWRNEQDAFNWIFRERKFACVIMPENCNVSALGSPRFRDMTNVEFACAGYVLLTPKPDSAGDAPGIISKKDALDLKR